MDLSFDWLLKYKWPLYRSSSSSQEYLGKLDNWTTIVVSYENFWDRVAISGKQFGANLVQ
jgi:hypothetical protein